MSRRVKGAFITVEGVEGCGKTTQTERLCEYLRRKGREVVATREPGGVPIAEALRTVLLDPGNKTMSAVTELLLYAAARAQHVDELIRPALDRGAVVVCDRFADSTTAYQGAGRGLPFDVIETLHRIAARDTWPDLTIVLDVPPEQGLARTAHAGPFDRVEEEPLAFHQRVREEFLQIAQREPGRVKVLDGTRTADEVFSDIEDLVDRLLERI